MIEQFPDIEQFKSKTNIEQVVGACWRLLLWPFNIARTSPA
jgi:hypothetical protein